MRCWHPVLQVSSPTTRARPLNWTRHWSSSRIISSVSRALAFTVLCICWSCTFVRTAWHVDIIVSWAMDCIHEPLPLVFWLSSLLRHYRYACRFAAALRCDVEHELQELPHSSTRAVGHAALVYAGRTQEIAQLQAKSRGIAGLLRETLPGETQAYLQIDWLSEIDWNQYDDIVVYVKFFLLIVNLLPVSMFLAYRPSTSAEHIPRLHLAMHEARCWRQVC